jgi:hypothetical protein
MRKNLKYFMKNRFKAPLPATARSASGDQKSNGIQTGKSSFGTNTRSATGVSRASAKRIQPDGSS